MEINQAGLTTFAYGVPPIELWGVELISDTVVGTTRNQDTQLLLLLLRAKGDDKVHSTCSVFTPNHALHKFESLEWDTWALPDGSPGGLEVAFPAGVLSLFRHSRGRGMHVSFALGHNTRRLRGTHGCPTPDLLHCLHFPGA